MMNFAFVAALAIGLFILLSWGVRTLPAERWQMLAAVPVAKAADGSWRGVNLTFYGFFSATGTAFGFAILLILLAAVDIPANIAILLAVFLLSVCVPASRLIAGLVERKRNTFTVAGAAFVASLTFPVLVLGLRPLAAKFLHHQIAVLPILAAAAISYALGESIGRLACLSFGCCYGMPLRDAKADSRPPLPEAQPGDLRFHQESCLCFGACRRAADSGAGDHFGSVRRRRGGGTGSVSIAALSFGSPGSGDCKLGMARCFGVAACGLSRWRPNFRLPGDGNTVGRLPQYFSCLPTLFIGDNA